MTPLEQIAKELSELVLQLEKLNDQVGSVLRLMRQDRGMITTPKDTP